VSRKCLIFAAVSLPIAVIGFLAGVGWVLGLGMTGVLAGVFFSAISSGRGGG